MFIFIFNVMVSVIYILGVIEIKKKVGIKIVSIVKLSINVIICLLFKKRKWLNYIYLNK